MSSAPHSLTEVFFLNVHPRIISVSIYFSLSLSPCVATGSGPEPDWHVKLEATYQPDGGGAGQRGKGLSVPFPRGKAPQSHRSTSSGRGHASTGGPGPSGHRRDPKRRQGGGRGGGEQRREEPFWWADVQQPNKPAWTKAQKKRAKLKRDAEEIEKRKRRKTSSAAAGRGRGPSAQAAAAGAKSKKRKKAGTASGASSGYDTAGSAKNAAPRRKKKKLPGFE